MTLTSIAATGPKVVSMVGMKERTEASAVCPVRSKGKAQPRMSPELDVYVCTLIGLARCLQVAPYSSPVRGGAAH